MRRSVSQGPPPNVRYSQPVPSSKRPTCLKPTIRLSEGLSHRLHLGFSFLIFTPKVDALAAPSSEPGLTIVVIGCVVLIYWIVEDTRYAASVPHLRVVSGL